MTRKRFQKLLRAHFTAFYLQHKDTMQGWIADAYRAAQHATARDHQRAYETIVAMLPIDPT